jgi:Xaa-Pro aminopeptidase
LEAIFMAEWQGKQKIIREFMAAKGIEVLHLSRWSNFAWLTGGKQNQVGVLTDTGAASILLTPEGNFVLSNTIEHPRLRDEEKLEEQGYHYQILPWFEAQAGKSLLPDLAKGRKLYGDTPAGGAVDISGELNPLRWVMLPEELKRYAELGRDCTTAIETTARQVRPGMTEYEIAALLSSEAMKRNIVTSVNLIATDERIYNYRHPVPQNRKLQKQAMLVLGGRRGGLIASITRMVHFGKIPDELQKRQHVCLQVEAAFITATKPGAVAKDIFAIAQAAYASQGWPDEWQMHHQGGAAGYNGREFVAHPACNEIVRAGMVFAWNPSVKGAKVEDTFVVFENGREWLTGSSDWPTARIEANGEVLKRPTILEL